MTLAQTGRVPSGPKTKSEHALTNRGLEDQNREQNLQREPPRDGLPVDRPPVVRAQHGDGQDHQRAEHRLQDRQHQRTSPTIKGRGAGRSSPTTIAAVTNCMAVSSRPRSR
jgi:hypothetical protein